MPLKYHALTTPGSLRRDFVEALMSARLAPGRDPGHSYSSPPPPMLQLYQCVDTRLCCRAPGCVATPQALQSAPGGLRKLLKLHFTRHVDCKQP